MTPPPKIVLVVKNEGGKEIGGGNHYCTICRAPAPPTAPASETMSDTVPPSGGQEQPTADSTRDSARTADGSDMSTAKEWFKAVLKIQHSSIVQAQEDRRQALEDRRADRQMFLAVHQASADRIGRLEDLLLAMNVKNEVNARPTQPTTSRQNQDSWPTSSQKRTYSRSNANEAAGFLTKSWGEFKARMFDFALPTNWRSGLQRQIRKLDITSTETFLEYSTRARTLQSLFNFDAEVSSKLGDLQRAQFVVYGLSDALQDRINERQLRSTAKSATYYTAALGRTIHLASPAYLDSQGLWSFLQETLW
ncbi:hypothetical protein PGT21_000728 [Puccinia graminis f. sp. tritici]|uniref:Retrotransposon gag domain-containing protein n=1 Tax=Puccinia graminis f. sp. tritici TaxID=56615 RepID=A0A5B0PBW0_PUCGR|nr:hypothetical protein PGT21_000728 [Puccinia graminis f. sp. tritici]